jgi:hypothetical protein
VGKKQGKTQKQRTEVVHLLGRQPDQECSDEGKEVAEFHLLTHPTPFKEGPTISDGSLA